MTPAIWVTMLCFPFTGCVAIFHATRVVTLLDAGDRDGAKAASRKARKWVVISMIAGAIMIIATIVVILVGFYYYVTVVLDPDVVVG
jgi:hypothetical protein